MAPPAPRAAYPLRIFSHHIPSPPSLWGTSTSITPSRTHFVNSPLKTSQFLPPTSIRPWTWAILSSISLVSSPGSHSTPPPDLVSLTSPSPTQLLLPSSKAGNPLSRPLGQTMFQLPYYSLRPCYAHHLLPQTGTNQTGILSRNSLNPLGSPSPPVCPPITRSPRGSTDIFGQSPLSSSTTHRRKAPPFNQIHCGQTNLVHSAGLSTQLLAGAESSLLPPTLPTRKTSRKSTFTLSNRQRPPTGNSS